MRFSLGGLILLFAVVALASGQASAGKLDKEFQVNTRSEYGQSDSGVATLSRRDFVVVWQSYFPDAREFDIRAQRYRKGRQAGGEFVVNTRTAGDQTRPSIAALANGDFVVVWQSELKGIRGQRFTKWGKRIGKEFLVSRYSVKTQANPSIAALADGGFVVVFTALKEERSLLAQRYDRHGDKMARTFKVNTGPKQAPHGYTGVTGLPNGGFVVVWWLEEINARRYNRKGKPVSGILRVNTDTIAFQHHQQQPPVTALSNGGFVVAWRSGTNLHGQRFSGKAVKQGAEFQLNTYGENTHSNPALAPLGNGWFVAVWPAYGQDGHYFGIFGQKFDKRGKKRGPEFQVNTTTQWNQDDPAIAGFADDRFLVTWSGNHEFNGHYDVFARRMR
ncbi:hypothetical protein [Microbaculum marinum]|uniref:Uncharacterized protein n=1 Tax=Microbaculum marinum TaxID=1764581 RepID=A0AAW9RKD5_9HYPH